MTTLARWRQAKLEEEGGSKSRRPYLASLCSDLKEAEKWRLEIIREISKKVTQIQNAGLGEFRIRDLNDQINKLLREKRHWEYRIAELGGRDFRRAPGPNFEKAGRSVPGARGYKYFGAAKDLPGVRNLFQQELPPPARKTRAELMQNIDADYYGYRDEDDGVIVPLQQEAQREAIQKAIGRTDVDLSHLEVKLDSMEEEEGEIDGADFVGPKNFMSHVPNIPSQAKVEQALVQRKKEQLLAQFLNQ